MMRFSVVLALCSTIAYFRMVAGDHLPEEISQRWLMIIKPYVDAGEPFVGSMTQGEIDNVTTAFKFTWPETIRNITRGQVNLEAHVIVSPLPLTSVSQSARGMVTPDDIPEDTAALVSPADWDGVAIYAGFKEFAYWGTASAADVGWFSVSHSDSVSAGSWTIAAWTHESLHSMAWYFGDGRLGPVAPLCPDSPEGTDGTHCAPQYGYNATALGLKDFMGWHEDYLTGNVEGEQKGLGSEAWKLGTRREAYLGLAPGALKAQEQGYIDWLKLRRKRNTVVKPMVKPTSWELGFLAEPRGGWLALHPPSQ